jgi:UDP-N-acetylmuramoylalanine--D-glutamate ligase
VKNILIIGAESSGMGAAILARKNHYNVKITSINKITKKNKTYLDQLAINFEEESHSIDSVIWSDLIIKSPGVPSDIPLILEANNQLVPVISEIEFAASFTDAKIIAITGTNGKTTTALLLYDMFLKAGLNADLVGNIGISFAESVALRKCDYYILEVSSFQLDNIVDFKPNVSIILNIQEDHLDRYDNQLHKYINSKINIIKNQDVDDLFIYFNKDLNIHSHLHKVKSQKYSFGPSKLKENYGGWIQDNQLIIKTIKTKFTMTIHNLALQGNHNYYNSMAASIAASSMEIDSDIIKKCLSDFKGIEHRLEFVTNVNGVQFINDSKATNCNSVFYAIETINKPIVWICGGIDKGNDYSILKNLVKNKVKSIVFIGDNSDKITKNFKDCTEGITIVKSMHEAVDTANALAVYGDTVLLSPACASFDLFKNYEHRGRAFKSAVLAI